jgi:hypothetical protein
MKSWKKLKGYEFVHWNMERFPLSKSVWVKEAFEAKKYAFAADYIRLYALYHYGGIYLDSDVEVLKPFDEFLELREMVGHEDCTTNRIELAAWGVEPHAPWVKLCLDYYEGRHFIKENGEFDMTPITHIVDDLLREHGYKLINVDSIENAKNVGGDKMISIFPQTFFSPKHFRTGKLMITKTTYCIHQYVVSWHGSRAKLAEFSRFCYRILGRKTTEWLMKLYGKSFLYRE